VLGAPLAEPAEADRLIAPFLAGAAAPNDHVVFGEVRGLVEHLDREWDPARLPPCLGVAIRSARLSCPDRPRHTPDRPRTGKEAAENPGNLRERKLRGCLRHAGIARSPRRGAPLNLASHPTLGADPMTLSRGRDMLAIPGPSIIPDRVLNAMHRPAPNIYEGELVAITGTIIADLGRVARTDGRVAVYIGNGHAAWEAAIANTLAPGDKALVVATGRFGLGWADTARRMGVEVEVVDFGFRAGLDPERIAERLRADRGHAIRAVLAVQVDTASSVRNDIAELRAALDAAGHPGLLMVDCIACLGCDRFEMDALGVDVALAACQKGLMTPPGLAFTFHNAKAEAARVRCPSPYWDWGPRTEPEAYYQLFCGTAPTHHLYGLRCALDIILEEEGLERVWHRHAIFARAIWAAVEAWGAGGDLALNIAEPRLRSHAVTTIRTAKGDGARLRRWCAETAGLTLGIGLSVPGIDPDGLFRIGHMGHLNPPMLLGTLATIEAGLAALGIAHGRGALESAARAIAGGGAPAPGPVETVDLPARIG
jgi:alanine-glyoxylate transaminase/serine-glyoxylate transaminase/serine-pyruvate transaminase